MSKRLTRAARERVEMYDRRERRWADRINQASMAMIASEDRAVEEYVRYGR